LALIIEKTGPITIISLNRPKARNAVDPETAIELRTAFADFDKDSRQLVAVLTGTEGTFCAGFDLKVAANQGSDIKHDPQGEGPMGPSRMLLSKPVIAAVEGHAVAGGLELALWCDLRVISETAIFGVFCRRWGVPLIDGGTVRLPRLIGQSRALDMVLTGRAVKADEALEFGLANRKVPKGEALPAAIKLALEISKFPQICMRADRMSVHQQWSLDFSDALVSEAIGGLKPLVEETQAGAARFAAGKGRGGDFTRI
jgi:enoyl-CoA hydratase/carnithine racemase